MKMLCYRCSRGLDIYKIEDSFYILDQFGNKEILKFENENDLKNIIETNYNINIIVNEEYCENCSSRFIRTVCRSDSDSFKVEIF
ncbi:hypothetical protein [Aliarcobacter butzleri]|uniref:hypothetical protein n=1 Tax=Aliarcobacter butzleri TaxID=28197 RepID=UPI00138E1CCF|nr:hypothetical protein [Aliarcobacter butzleri]